MAVVILPAVRESQDLAPQTQLRPHRPMPRLTSTQNNLSCSTKVVRGIDMSVRSVRSSKRVIHGELHHARGGAAPARPSCTQPAGRVARCKTDEMLTFTPALVIRISVHYSFVGLLAGLCLYCGSAVWGNEQRRLAAQYLRWVGPSCGGECSRGQAELLKAV